MCLNICMNYIFYFLIVISIILGAVNGKLQDVVNAILSGAELSVKVAFSLIGIMAFWLGIMKIAERSGIVDFIAKILKPVAKWLYRNEFFSKCFRFNKCGNSNRFKGNGRIARD